ncbi:uncharacterized protein BDW70DRAFT_136325 [Aspergillus foveolatus]|uniref:uncharacterized protein n=1 Tax=Aspergillus foveolatus TaxID=210207 RepID=UPI003CCD7858
MIETVQLLMVFTVPLSITLVAAFRDTKRLIICRKCDWRLYRNSRPIRRARQGCSVSASSGSFTVAVCLRATCWR